MKLIGRGVASNQAIVRINSTELSRITVLLKQFGVFGVDPLRQSLAKDVSLLSNSFAELSETSGRDGYFALGDLCDREVIGGRGVAVIGYAATDQIILILGAESMLSIKDAIEDVIVSLGDFELPTLTDLNLPEALLVHNEWGAVISEFESLLLSRNLTDLRSSRFRPCLRCKSS